MSKELKQGGPMRSGMTSLNLNFTRPQSFGLHPEVQTRLKDILAGRHVTTDPASCTGKPHRRPVQAEPHHAEKPEKPKRKKPKRKKLPVKDNEELKDSEKDTKKDPES